MNTKIFIASDHAGVELKAEILNALYNHTLIPNSLFEVHDLGPQSTNSVDYPDYADLLAHKIHSLSVVQTEVATQLPNDVGILICGSGQGMCMRANKYVHIRAALCHSVESAKLAREHNDANVLCLGARLVDSKTNLDIARTFLSTFFAGGRHTQRVVKVNNPV